ARDETAEVGRLADVTSDAVVNQFGESASRKRDDRKADAPCFERHVAERLVAENGRGEQEAGPHDLENVLANADEMKAIALPSGLRTVGQRRRIFDGLARPYRQTADHHALDVEAFATQLQDGLDEQVRALERKNLTDGEDRLARARECDDVSVGLRRDV